MQTGKQQLMGSNLIGISVTFISFIAVLFLLKFSQALKRELRSLSFTKEMFSPVREEYVPKERAICCHA